MEVGSDGLDGFGGVGESLKVGWVVFVGIFVPFLKLGGGDWSVRRWGLQSLLL